MVTSTQNRLFTVDEYYKMAEAGILREDDRVELLRGEIVQMTPIGNRHASCVNKLNRFLSRNLPETFIVSVQNPVHIGEHSAPQPDISVLKHIEDYYKSSAPTESDTMLIIEVADSSLLTDKNVKIPLYAGSGIPEAWLVDLTTNTIIVYREPTSQGYQLVQSLGWGKILSPLADPNLEIQVDWILG